MLFGEIIIIFAIYELKSSANNNDNTLYDTFKT